MSTVFGLDVKIKKSRPRIQIAMIAICFVTLLVYSIVIGMIYADNTRLSKVVPSFVEALDDRDYNTALSIYRDIHELVVSVDPNSTESVFLESLILKEMEDVVAARVYSVMNLVRYERYVPGPDDNAFFEGLEELTGVLLSTWLNDLAEEFLVGTIEKPTLIFIYDQVGHYSNISATALQLRTEIDVVEIFRGDVQIAEQLYSEAQYIEAAKVYISVIEASDGFVRDYSEKRLDSLKEEMYSPIMEHCDFLFETFKFYTLESILSDMIRIFPDDSRVQSRLLEATSRTSILQPYFGQIEVISIRPIIADTTRAFSVSSSLNTEAFYLTHSEFRLILESLYERNYVLVDPHALVDVSHSSFLIERTLMVPEGKKPLIIVIENLSYSAYQWGNGLCHRLVINDQGHVSGEYLSAQDQIIVGRQAEAIGILDVFVEEHPDFSLDGVKGVISVSGYETVLGYVVDVDQIDDRNAAFSAVGLPMINPNDFDIENERQELSKVVVRLRETGWFFGSSTYGFISARSSDQEMIEYDTEKWMEQVMPYVGGVHILVYPYGDFIPGSDPRCVYLKDLGFRIFFGVGSTPYYVYGDNYLYYDRAILNGDTLRSIDYSRLFNVEEVYDIQRTRPLS